MIDGVLEPSPYRAHACAGKKQNRHAALLIAVVERCRPSHVYAVVARANDSALATIQAQSPDSERIEVVGGLSRDLTRSLGLKTGDIRRI